MKAMPKAKAAQAAQATAPFPALQSTGPKGPERGAGSVLSTRCNQMSKENERRENGKEEETKKVQPVQAESLFERKLAEKREKARKKEARKRNKKKTKADN